MTYEIVVPIIADEFGLKSLVLHKTISEESATSIEELVSTSTLGHTGALGHYEVYREERDALE